MRKKETGHLLYVMFTLMTIICCGVFALEAVANNENTKTINAALESGDIKLILEGIENGEKLIIKVEKKKSSSLILVIPKGNAELKIGGGKTITINASQEIQIDLSKATTGEAQVPQTGRIRLLKGSIEMENSSHVMSYSYHNAEFSVNNKQRN
ncbi:MAG TPA: hypothetical protein VMU29_00280 [Smithella sp.]|nr:hypothetical protein [Smithella sp.]